VREGVGWGTRAKGRAKGRGEGVNTKSGERVRSEFISGGGRRRQGTRKNRKKVALGRGAWAVRDRVKEVRWVGDGMGRKNHKRTAHQKNKKTEQETNDRSIKKGVVKVRKNTARSEKKLAQLNTRAQRKLQSKNK